jgi:dTDP-4-dehydrorhamnose reductase
VAILGATGQLGGDLVAALEQSGQFEVFALGHDQADCTHADSVRQALLAARPETVVNCAAFVRVDECEVQVREAFDVNALGALNVARVCAAIDANCVYVSTDYVFDGEKRDPYVESDATCPINVYGASKLAGEHLVRQALPRWLIFRVASLFGELGARGKGGNFVETILAKARRGESLRVVSDIQISPTYTRDAARVLSELVQSETTGIIHAANSGACTWHEFAQAAVELCRLNVPIQAISSDEYPTPARRPKNSALVSERFGTSSLIPHWRDALRRYLIEKRYVDG